MNTRTLLQVAALALTTLALIATSQAPPPCAPSTLTVSAATTCGMNANISLASDVSCNVAANGAGFGGLPTSGVISGKPADAGLDQGFNLTEFLDGGAMRTCVVTPATDGGTGFDVSCRDCAATGGMCNDVCSGTLSPQ
ncbi:MAG: hypothetical protein QM817_36125 [Archangium sp.]